MAGRVSVTAVGQNHAAAAILKADEPLTSPSSAHKSRVRRPTDLLLAILALAGVGLLFGIAHGLPIGTRELTLNVASWLTHNVPRPLAFLFVSGTGLGSLVLVGVASVVLLRSDVRDALNSLAASLAGIAVAVACVIEWQSRRGGVATAMLQGTNAAILVLTIGFFAFITGTDLARRPRWTRWCILAVVLLPLGELTAGDITFFALLAAPLGGWGVGLLVRWILTVASVGPAPESLLVWMQQSGIPAASLSEAALHQDFCGVLNDGTAMTVMLESRDTRGAGLARRLWKLLRFREAEAGGHVFSSRAQLKERALASYAATSAEILAPRVLILGEIPPETLVLALGQPKGSTPDEATSSDQLSNLFRALRRLHEVGVAHRDLRAQSLLVDRTAAGFASMNKAQAGAGSLTRRLDLAQILTTLAQLVGAEQAVRAFREGYRPDKESDVVSILQPVALAPWGWSGMREAKGCLAEVRQEFVGPDETPSSLRLERFRWRTVLTTIALTLAAYLIVGQLSKVNLLGALRAMNPGWFLVAVAASGVTYFAAALNLAAFVPKRLSLVRGFWVQLSTAFVGLAMPPTMGHVAVNSRYLRRQGVDNASIAAAVALSQIVNVGTTVPLLVIIGVLTGSGVSRFKIAPGADLLIGIACIAVVLVALSVVPTTRSFLLTHVWKPVSTAVPRVLEAISQPLRMIVGISANLLLTSSYAVALYAALLAVGAHPPVLATVAVFLAGNTVGSLAPTPGGLGAVEAVMVAGLTAIGTPAHEAVPAVLLFRVATFWLPIPAGWISFMILERKGTL